MIITKNLSVQNEIIKSILAIILSVIIAYIIHFIVHLPFTITKLIISITIPTIVLPFFIIPNYKHRKAVFLAKEELNISLIEKTELVQEVHHRVKNNLSIILSLLHLQNQTSLCKENTELCYQNYERRVRTISMVHEHILKSPDYSNMDLRNFILEQKDIIITLVDNPYRQIEIDIAPIQLKIKLANTVPIGLIISELLMNSLQYAFQDREKGEVKIWTIESGQNTIFTFEDNGIGISEDLISGNTDTIGMTLISILVNQIKGKFKFQNTGGTKFSLTFKN